MIGIAIQQFHHICSIFDFKKGKAEVNLRCSWNLYGPVTDLACAVCVGKIWGIDHSCSSSVIPSTGTNKGCVEEREKNEKKNRLYIHYGQLYHSVILK